MWSNWWTMSTAPRTEDAISRHIQRMELLIFRPHSALYSIYFISVGMLLLFLVLSYNTCTHLNVVDYHVNRYAMPPTILAHEMHILSATSDATVWRQRRTESCAFIATWKPFGRLPAYDLHVRIRGPDHIAAGTDSSQHASSTVDAARVWCALLTQMIWAALRMLSPGDLLEK